MNITEFSQIAGVSKSAVSRYFNNGYLSDCKKELIKEVIDKTGYSPNPQAQTIRTRVTKLVGVIIPKLSSESCSRVVDGISEILDKEGYNILLVNTKNDEHKELEYLNLFKQNRVDGVVLLASIFTKNHSKVLKNMKIPVVIVGQEWKGFNCVCHDDYGASYMLTTQMIEKGAKKIAYIGVSDSDMSAGFSRKKGFKDALSEANIDIIEQNIKIADFDIQSGYHQMKKILLESEIPDAIFCATDQIAIGAKQYLLEKSIKVPNQVMISSVGDTLIGKITEIPLTSARLHYKTSGMESANMLLELIRKNETIPKTIKLDYNIEYRKSTER